MIKFEFKLKLLSDQLTWTIFHRLLDAKCWWFKFSLNLVCLCCRVRLLIDGKLSIWFKPFLPALLTDLRLWIRRDSHRQRLAMICWRCSCGGVTDDDDAIEFAKVRMKNWVVFLSSLWAVRVNPFSFYILILCPEEASLIPTPLRRVM